MPEEKQVQKKSAFDKMFLNEHGEVSLTKIGVVFTAIGTALLANPPVAIVVVIAKYLITFGGMFAALGALSKFGRKKK